MTQYCRYCSNAVFVDDENYYCENDHRVYINAKARRTNKCKNFVFNSNDLLRNDENGFAQYKPRGKIKPLDQITFTKEENKK